MVELSKPVIVFDLDDTLYLERDFAKSGYRTLGYQFADRLDGPAFSETCSQLLDAGVRGEIFDLALKAQGLVPQPDLVDTLVKAYREHTPTITLAEDAQRFLARAAHRTTGLITDGPEQVQASKVSALGLGSQIDHIILTGSLAAGMSKPHPRAFEMIEQQTKRAAADYVYIADNGAKDFVAPNRMGWRTIQILRPGRIHDCTPPTPAHSAQDIIASFDEIELRG